jgi:glucokinase
VEVTSGVVLAIDVGGTRTKYGLVALDTGELLALDSGPTVTRGLMPFIVGIDAALEILCRRARVPRDAIQSIGIGLPGCVLGDSISMIWDALAYTVGDHFRPELERELGLPVRIDNDARVVGLGEAHHGAGRSARRLLSLTLGTGVGFAFLVDGRLQEPTSINHMAGHILIRPGARPCYCGISGCLETLVGGPTLVERYGELARRDPAGGGDGGPDVAAVFAAAADGDPAGQQVVGQLVDDLSAGLNVYANVFAPDTVVLGGGVAQGLVSHLPALQARLVARPFEGYSARVVPSALGEKAGIYGAASLWRADEGL